MLAFATRNVFAKFLGSVSIIMSRKLERQNI
jgi:hypothetical protein